MKYYLTGKSILKIKFFFNPFPYIFLIVLISCNKMNYPLKLVLKDTPLTVVQQIPADNNGRNKNVLYLPPRAIQKKEFNSKELNILIDSMYSVMIEKAGVGIAANQIGKRLQLFIIEAKSNNPRYKVLGEVKKQLFINPKITKVSEKKKNFWHGCLSANGEKRGNVATYEWLEYECFNERGEKIIGQLEGFGAVIFQHEFRHLMNGTYMDFAKEFLDKPALDEGINSGKIPFFDEAPPNLPLLIQGYEIGESLEEFHKRKRKI